MVPNRTTHHVYGLIPVSILKQCVDAYLPFLTISINCFSRENTFPEELKHSEAIPLHKKLDPLKKENYRPVSLPPDVTNHLQTNKHLYGRQTIKMFQKISRNLTFACNHALKMEKKAVDKIECVPALF